MPELEEGAVVSNRARMGYQIPENAACSYTENLGITKRETRVAGRLGSQLHEQSHCIERQLGVRRLEGGRFDPGPSQQAVDVDVASAEKLAIVREYAGADARLAEGHGKNRGSPNG